MGQTNVNVPGDGSSGMGAGMIVGLVLAVIVIGFVVWLLLNNGGGGGTPTQSTPLDVLPSVLPSVVPSAALLRFLA